jgi:glycosyltransferase involved in cell wall biosynthesis
MNGFILLCLKLDTEKHGGVQMRIRNYVDNLSRFNFQPVVLLASDAKKPTQSYYRNAPLITIPKRNILPIIWTIVTTIFRYNVTRIHVIEGTTGIAQIIALALSRILLLKTSVAVYSGEFVDIYSHPSQTKQKIMFWITLLLTQKIAVNSRATASLLPKYHKKIRIVYPGVSMALLSDPKDPSPYRKQYKLLFVGRHFRRKGIDDILTALSLLPQEISKSLECLFVGKDVETTPDTIIREAVVHSMPVHEISNKKNYSLTSFYKKLAKHKKVDHLCRFAGEVIQITPYYAHADIVMLPSKIVKPVEGYEGFGNVLTEAALFGKPTIATKHFGIPEAVIHNKTGLLIDESNPKALAEAIAFLLTHPSKARALGAAGYRRVISRFTDRASTKSLVQLFA